MKNGRNTRGRGEGAIEELPSGKFRARAPGGIDPITGKRSRYSQTFPTIQAAREWLRSQLVARDRGKRPASGAESLADWCAEWLEGKRISTGQHSYRNYETHARLYILPGLGSVRLRDLDSKLLKRWMSALAVSPTHKRKVAVSFSVMLNDAVREGRLASNPMKGVPRPKAARKEIEVFSLEELRKLLSAIAGESPAGPLFQVLADSGCRPAEALALHWPDVDFSAGTIRIRRALEETDGAVFRLKEPKSQAGNRTVTLSPLSLASLKALLTRTREEERDAVRGPVFVHADGSWLSRGWFRAAWKRAVRLAKVPHRKPYCLRHTSAALLLAAGVNIRTVSRRLGHEDIAVTLRHYAGLMPDADQQAADVMGKLLGGNV